jgi:CRISPR/Cas system-associated exonuclease Cas4 (RecB family)
MGEMNKLSTYAWTPDSDKIIRISKSTLDNYSNWCAQQLWLSKVCPQEDKEHDYLVIGSNVHDRQEEFYNIAKENKPLVEDAIAHAKQGNDKRAFELLLSIYPESTGDYAERESPMQEWLIRNDVLRLKHCETPDDWLPVGNELDLDALIDVEINLGTKDEPIMETHKVHLRGIIDRIFSDGEDGVALMELKTGKWRAQYDVPKMKGEMAYYAYVLEESGAADDLGPVTHWGWRYPGADHWDYMKATKVSITAMKKRLAKLVKSYVEQDFPTVSSREEYKCGYCEFMSFCPKWTPYENPVEVANGADPVWKDGADHA